MGSTNGAAPRRSRSLVERVEAVRRARPDRALALLERGFAAAVRGADDAGRGELWRLRGHVLRALQRAREAAVAYRRAATCYRRAGAPREQGRCAIGLTDALMYLGRYGEAQRAAAAGRRLLERAGDRVSLARLLNNEGNLFHRLDLPERAMLRYREARRALARAGDASGAARVDGNVANCLSLLGRLEEARRLYRGARRVHAAAGLESDALIADYNLAYLDFLEHRHEAALEGLARVRDDAAARGLASIAALAALDRAEIFLRIGAHDEALAESRRAIADCGAVELSYERAKAETFAALAEFRLGRPGAARARLERTLAAFHREGNAVWTGETLLGLATVWWRDANPGGAAALLAAARGRFALAGDRERECCVLALLARARLEAGDPRGARTALAAQTRLEARAPRAWRGSPRLRHLALAARAVVARAGGDIRGARRSLERAAREAERLAARILDEHWRATFWGEWGWPHRELAALELTRGRVAAAFEALEGGRGRALLGPTSRGRRAAAHGPRLPRRVRAWAAARMAGERGRAIRAGAAAAAPAAPASPVPGALARSLEARPPAAIRAAALRRALPADHLLLDYLIHADTLQLIAARREGFTGRTRLLSTARLSRLVHALLFDLRGAAFRPAAERGVTASLRDALTELAAGVLWPALAGAPLPRALAVMPVGPLTRVPWAALPLPDGRLVCEAMDLTVLPGLRLGLARPRRAPRDLARAGGDPPLVVASDAGELENVGPETRAVLQAFPEARLLSGPEATAGRLLELCRRAPWIHFAGHGIFRADAPQHSGLRLADRWVLAGELADMSLRARWITLSACQTARALVEPGEEWFGLARALLLAGARRVLAAQWDVADEAAARLMAGTYGRLRNSATLPGALRGAQAEAARSGIHPLEWAGFVLLGSPLPAPGDLDRSDPQIPAVPDEHLV